MIFRQLFEPTSSTYTYLLADEHTKEALLIDPVRETLERDVELLGELGLTLRYVLETHVHADHVTSAGVLRERLGAKTAVSRAGGAPCADLLLDDGDVVRVGSLAIVARSTPGHTNGCMTFVADEGAMAFTGDALLIRGTGRTDFQEGDARTLYRSIHEKIFTLDDDALLYPAHDYRGRTVTTVGEEKQHNPRVGQGRSEEDFVAIMKGLKLAPPQQLDVAVPANRRCGLVDQATPAADPPSADPPAGDAGGGRDAPWAPVQRTPAGVPEVTAAWVRDRARGRTRVVDVREEAELRGPLGALPGAENIPLGALLRNARTWSRDEPLVLICRSGARSGEAALALETMGFQRVASMKGGMIAMTEARR